MFVVEYFCKFREFFTTQEIKNCGVMGVVASKHQVN